MKTRSAIDRLATYRKNPVDNWTPEQEGLWKYQVKLGLERQEKERTVNK